LSLATKFARAALRHRFRIPAHKALLAPLSAVVAIYLSSHFTTAAKALTIELKDAAPDRIERQRRAVRGELPLPGTPQLSKTTERLEKLGLKAGTPVLIRIFKESSELELWLLGNDRYVHFATYPICHWSGTLGPKLAEGDKQSPEGFYTITRRQIHHSGRWPRSLNLGFPNVLDRALLRTGSYILIHGGCSSVGCFAMTNAVISEVFGLVAMALQGGQRFVPVHIFPFRMTETNLKTHRTSEWIGFWRNLKKGYDSFQRNRLPPSISVCNGHYQVRDARGPLGGENINPLDKKVALRMRPGIQAEIAERCEPPLPIVNTLRRKQPGDLPAGDAAGNARARAQESARARL
jgi:murein L,D-transpeptidase YafK